MATKEETNKKWIPTDRRFVAFLDILGFRDLVMRSTHDEIYTLLSSISELRSKIDDWNDDTESKRYDNAGSYTVSFSDSIVIFSKSDTVEDFDLFTYSVSWLFARAMEKGIPLKGGLAYGQVSLNKSSQIYFGQPIIDAYLLEEEVNYFGIVAHHSLEEFFYRNQAASYAKNDYKEIVTSLKCGSISHLNLDWVRHLNGKSTTQRKAHCFDLINKFKYKASGSPRRYIDNTIKAINDFYPNKS